MTIQIPDWLEGVDALPGPKYKAIAQQIAAAVGSGALKPGDRLPPQRELAWALECTVGTISRAYAEAEKRGLLGGEVGRGTYVREEFEAASSDSRGISGYWHSPSFEKAGERVPSANDMDGIADWSPDMGPAERETGPIGFAVEAPYEVLAEEVLFDHGFDRIVSQCLRIHKEVYISIWLF